MFQLIVERGEVNYVSDRKCVGWGEDIRVQRENT